jgi:hypothetical protein
MVDTVGTDVVADQLRNGRASAPTFAGVVARVAAGASFRLVTNQPPWAGRYGHTTVIDAAGNIYLMGGLGDGFGNYFNDVWKGTNFGENRTRGVLRGYSRGANWVPGGTQETLKDAQGVLKGCSRGTSTVEAPRGQASSLGANTHARTHALLFA